MASGWSRAAELADRTPASRNRYVDFLRAMSMLIVTVGHWLAAAPYRLAHVVPAGHAGLLLGRRVCEWH